MEHHPNLSTVGRQEIRCRDCGHVYAVAAGQRSSRCEVCGNIEFHGEAYGESFGNSYGAVPAVPPRVSVAEIPAVTNPPSARPSAFPGASRPVSENGNHFALPPELLAQFAAANASGGSAIAAVVAESTTPRGGAAPAEIPRPMDTDAILARFTTMPDGASVQTLLERYQVEWQIWAKLVKDFGDPALHAAYLARVTAARSFDEAAVRYREHRAVMTLNENTRWEADVAELMLSRVETLAALFTEKEAGNGFRVPAWLYVLPLQSKPFRIAWITLGMLAMARLFRVI